MPDDHILVKRTLRHAAGAEEEFSEGNEKGGLPALMPGALLKRSAVHRDFGQDRMRGHGFVQGGQHDRCGCLPGLQQILAPLLTEGKEFGLMLGRRHTDGQAEADGHPRQRMISSYTRLRCKIPKTRTSAPIT